MNYVIVAGNLTNDPELKELESTCVVTVHIAVNKFVKKNDQEGAVNKPTFITLEAWDTAARYLKDRFKKGDLIIAECSIQNYEIDGKTRIKFRMNRFDGPYVKVKRQ